MKRQHACREHRAFTLVELLVVVAIISILVGLLLPAISGAKASANKTVCLSNIKQVDTLLFMAISDENPRRFPNKGTINKLFQLHPGFTNSSKETKILECPSDRGLTAGGTCFVDSPTDPQSSYYYAGANDGSTPQVTKIANMNVTSFNPSRKVVFYEKTLTKANYKGWHNKLQSGACAFVDMHADVMIATNSTGSGTDAAVFY